MTAGATGLAQHLRAAGQKRKMSLQSQHSIGKVLCEGVTLASRALSRSGTAQKAMMPQRPDGTKEAPSPQPGPPVGAGRAGGIGAQASGFRAKNYIRNHHPGSRSWGETGMATEAGKVRGQGPGTSGLGSWGGRPGAILDAPKEREGRAPLRGLGELRPLEVGRQPPDLFPGIRHHGPTGRAAEKQQTRQPTGGGSPAERAARRDNRLHRPSNYRTRAPARAGPAQSRSPAHPAREACSPGVVCGEPGQGFCAKVVRRSFSVSLCLHYPQYSRAVIIKLTTFLFLLPGVCISIPSIGSRV